MARDSAVSELPTHDESHVKNWLAKRHYHWSDFDVEELARVVKARGYKIIVIIPAKNVADSVGGVIDETVKPLVEAGVVASVIALVTRVGDDRTAEVARAHGASVVYREDVVPEDIGPSLGKVSASRKFALERAVAAFLTSISAHRAMHFGEACKPRMATSSLFLTGILEIPRLPI